jgi:hypothetical protein
MDGQAFFKAYQAEIAAMRRRASRGTDVIGPVFVTEARYRQLLEAGACVLVDPRHVAFVRASYVGQPDPRGEGPAPDRPHAVITFLL